MLRSPCAGKLLQYTVEDGGHVDEGKVYAEIEVSFCGRAAGATFGKGGSPQRCCDARCSWDVQPAGAAGSVTVSPPPQVMKIIMTLAVEEAGRLHYNQRPGALLEAGCVIARLELDDPSKVKPVSLLGAAISSCQLRVGILGMAPRGQSGGAAMMGHHTDGRSMSLGCLWAQVLLHMDCFASLLSRGSRALKTCIYSTKISTFSMLFS